MDLSLMSSSPSLLAQTGNREIGTSQETNEKRGKEEENRCVRKRMEKGGNRRNIHMGKRQETKDEAGGGGKNRETYSRVFATISFRSFTSLATFRTPASLYLGSHLLLLSSRTSSTPVSPN